MLPPCTLGPWTLWAEAESVRGCKGAPGGGLALPQLLDNLRELDACWAASPSSWSPGRLPPLGHPTLPLGGSGQ